MVAQLSTELKLLESVSVFSMPVGNAGVDWQEKLKVGSNTKSNDKDKINPKIKHSNSFSVIDGLHVRKIFSSTLLLIFNLMVLSSSIS